MLKNVTRNKIYVAVFSLVNSIIIMEEKGHCYSE